MASDIFCDPCSAANKSLSATKYCSDCEERFCSECAESHDRFKAFKSHHVIDLSSVGFNIPISTQKNCNVHSEMLLDYYCTDHEIVCCKTCISNEHRVCPNVLPLELASKDVKKSALFSEVMEEIKYLITSLSDLNDNRQSSLQSLEKSKSAITQQIRAVKSNLLKQIDELERELTNSLVSFQRKHVMAINKQKENITLAIDNLKVSENEIYFLKKHGSSKQLFITLRNQVKNINSIEAQIKEMVSTSPEIDITFDEKKDVKIESFGSLLDNSKSCQVQYKPRKFRQAQIMTEQTNHIVGFEKDKELKLKTEKENNFRDVAITGDNKLLLTNGSISDTTLYVYRDCEDYETKVTFSSPPYGVTVIPGTNTAVVTLPDENSIQFINTTNITKADKVHVGFLCYGITAKHEKIYVGGTGGTIKTLDINGTILKTIQQGSDNIMFLAYDDIRMNLILRCHDTLCCVKLDGTLVFKKEVSRIAGVILDRQSNIYFGGYVINNIQRLTPDWTTCEEVLNKKDGMNGPFGMCFNNEFTKLFIISSGYTSVLVYKCT